MCTPFRTNHRVEFYDTDMAGVMHFTAFFRAMESAENALLRHLGLGIIVPSAEGPLSWPKVAVSCEFRSPARFDEVLNIEVHVTYLGKKSVSYDFLFSREEQSLAIGRFTSACCFLHPGQSLKATTIPPSVRKKLSQMMTNS